MPKVRSIAIDDEADAAYLAFLGDPVVRTEEVGDGILVDYAADGRPVGVEVLSVRRRVGSGDPRSYLKGLAEGLMLPFREAAE